MAGKEPKSTSLPSDVSELMFLIARFLSNGPCQRAAEVLIQELQRNKIFPQSFDWEGNPRAQTYDQLVRANSHIGHDYLLHMCRHLASVLDKTVPNSIQGISSFLGSGKASLLRTLESVKKIRWNIKDQMVLRHGAPLVVPTTVRQPLSVVQSLHARSTIGSGTGPGSIHSSIFSKMTMHDRKLGHLSAVYCVTIDRTGQYIITGADDALVKIWHAYSGRLLATLRGHGAEVSDMAVNFENTLLATGSNDKTVRVWNLQTKAPVTVLHGHTGNINSLQFSPSCKGDMRILMSSGADGCVCFWLWNAVSMHFNPKPKKFVERSHPGAQILCSSFSPGGMFVATGHTDHVIRVYFLYGSEPAKIGELEDAHEDKVDSIAYSNSSNRFISGSCDGTARIWHYERQEWRSTVLNMTTFLDSNGVEVTADMAGKPKDTVRVTMVSWNSDDTRVITAISDKTIKVWDSTVGSLLHVLKGHEDEVYVLDSNPMDWSVILSAGHDGNIILWDIRTGVKINSFHNNIPGQGHGAVYDCRFTPDGLSFAATDSHGQLLFFGYGQNKEIKKVPDQMFFHTDYRPLIRDLNGNVLDEQTQQPPHLMPPPFLVNIDGNPYPPELQRFVPGREAMKEQQLVPHVAVNEHGGSEVIGDQHHEEDPVAAAPAVPAWPSEQVANDNLMPVVQDHNYGRIQAINAGDQGYDDETEDEGGGPADQPGRIDDRMRPSMDGVILQLQHEIIANSMIYRYDDETEDEGGGPAHQPGRIDDRMRPSIDDMILQLQHEIDQRNNGEGAGNAAVRVAQPAHAEARADRSRGQEGRIGMRRVGEEEGVRHSLGNIRQQQASSSDLVALSKRVVVGPLQTAVLRASEEKRLAFADDEVLKYINERKKKPSFPSTPSKLFGNMSRGKNQQRAAAERNKQPKEQTARNRLTTRALYDTEEEEETEISHDSDDSSFSDWTMEDNSNQRPKRRSARRPKRKVLDSSSEDEEEENEDSIEYDDEEFDVEDDDDNDEEYKVYMRQPKKTPVPEKEESKDKGSKKKAGAVSGSAMASTSRSVAGKKNSKKKSSAATVSLPVITELKEEFRPPEWLTGTIPRKTPYVPQIGDEVMYFRQGHELYVNAVERHKLYEFGPSVLHPWQKNPNLREMELVKILSVRFEVKPPRLCTLKLGFLNADTGKLAGSSFSIRYHDMADVIDFLVLRQHFDISYRRRWKKGDRFRSMIDDQWWMGKIESQSPLSPLFPDSLFQCFYVKWDNGEYERLSPWDMEPINENLLPRDIGGGVPIDPEELKDLLYTPKSSEWHNTSREVETDRILPGLEHVMEHSASEPFNAPVDLNAFPAYGIMIEYPIDLSTIKARLENGYYRRISALLWDVKHIVGNAKKFNEDGTPISRSAAIVTETLVRFVSDKSSQDPMPILEKLSRGQKFIWGSKGGQVEVGSEEDFTKSCKQDASETSCSKPVDPDKWKTECAELLALLLDCEDAEPFKEPVDITLYPNYYTVIETPMDFMTVRSNLNSRIYSSPVDFAKDVRLIFSNSRTFNTNKRSRIFSMTLRLSAMFDERIQPIISSWRSEVKHKNPSLSINGLSSNGNDSHKQISEASGSRPPLVLRLRDSSQRSSEERTRSSRSSVAATTTMSTRRVATRAALAASVADHDSDTDKTEVDDSEEDGDETEVDEDDRCAISVKRANQYNEDDDTEVEDEDEVNVPTASSRKTHQKSQKRQKRITNGIIGAYRTRAQTGSLRPKRYLSSEDEEDRDAHNRDTRRAQSYSSRDSSREFVGEEEESDDDESSGNASDESEDSHSESDDHSSKAKRRHTLKAAKRKCPPSKIKTRSSKKSRVDLLDEGDTSDDTEDGESDLDSEEDCSRKPKPKRKATVTFGAPRPAKKNSSNSGTSATRTTRNQGKRTFNYLEDSWDEYEEDRSCLSVSSRGRIRKLTKRARANRADD